MVLLTNLQYNNIGIGIQREGTTDRRLFLILIPTFKMYVFLYSRRTDERTDKMTNALQVNEENTMPSDGQLQQYDNSTPQTRGTRRRKMRDEENRNARPLKRVQTTKHPEGNTTADKGSPYYRNFPESQQRNIHDTESDSHAIAGLQNSDVICY